MASTPKGSDRVSNGRGSPGSGIRFTAALQGRDLGDYLSPPFDMITAAVERDLLGRSEHNIVRLELAPREGADRYGYVAETQMLWEADGVLMRDAEPSVYVTEESFEYGEGCRRVVVSSRRCDLRSTTGGSSFPMNRRGGLGWKTALR